MCCMRKDIYLKFLIGLITGLIAHKIRSYLYIK